mgnify:CR=1 FL=1
MKIEFLKSLFGELLFKCAFFRSIETTGSFWRTFSLEFFLIRGQSQLTLKTTRDWMFIMNSK